MKKQKKIWLLKNELLIVLLFLMMNSCSFLEQDLKPGFAISNLCIKKEAEQNASILGGVYFDFFNKSQKQIVSMELIVRIYDKKNGGPAFTGSATINSNYQGLIEGLEKKEMCISLDDYIVFDSQMDLLLDAFLISKITYSDGTVWNDFFGLYGIYAN